MSADTGSPAGLAYMAVSIDLCILEVGRPVSGPSPITKIDHTRNNCVFSLHIVSMQLLIRKIAGHLPGTDCLHFHCDSNNGVPNRPGPTRAEYCPTYQTSQ
jgi:hypothetical protein